jgi:hypothetical protein
MTMKLARRLARLEASNRSPLDYVLRLPAGQIHSDARVLEAITQFRARTEGSGPLILLPQRMTRIEEWLANYGPEQLAG